ncbi:transglycosylase [Microsporum ferrugineum]
MKFTLAAVLLGALSVSAQTSTKCNPLKQSCPADPALSGTADFDFTHESPRFHASGGAPTYGKDGVSLTIGKRFDAPKLTSDFYIMFGHVEWVIKAAPGKGIVSSAVLLSDDLDEIDWEFLGGDNARVQSNFFGKGNTETYDRVGFHDAPNNNGQFHSYAVDWTATKTTWYIDGKPVRDLTPETSKNQYPQTPMRVLAGSWAGGDPSNNKGTIEWAGGETDFGQVPFTMFVKSIKVTDYSTGKEYRYTDMSGKWQSIEAVGGKVNGQGTPGKGPKVESSTQESSPSTSAPAPVPTVPGGGIGNPQAPTTGSSPSQTKGPSPTMTSLLGLPSSWIVTETGTGGVVTPTSAAETSHPSDHTSRSSQPVSSSASVSSGNGHGHEMTTSSGSGSTNTGSVPLPTGMPTASGGGSSASPTSPAMQAPGSAGAVNSVSRTLAIALCAMAVWAAL